MEMFEEKLIGFSQKAFEALKDADFRESHCLSYGFPENKIYFSLYNSSLLMVNFVNYNFILLSRFSDPEKFSSVVLKTFRFLKNEHLKMEKLGFIRMEEFHRYQLSFKDHDD